MREAIRETINGRMFIIRPLGALKGRKVLTRVTNELGAAVSGLSSGDAMDKVASLVTALSDETLEFLCDTFGAATQVHRDNGNEPFLVIGENRTIFDDEFSCNYSALIEWIICCFWLNYSDFLEGPGVESLLARIKSFTPKSQKTSTGSSGES